MAGYVGIGIPCGIMEHQIGMDALMAFVVSMTFYSGAGQFMVPSMWLAGQPIGAIVASVSFVNTRQILYSAAFSRFFTHVRKRATLLFSGTVTDESFGVNMAKFQEDSGWSAAESTMVNVMCMTTWALANAIGVLVGGAIAIPTAIASFAMTSIFICLLAAQKASAVNIVVIIVSALGVFMCKSIGLAGPAILLGAIAGVVAGLAFKAVRAS